MNLRQMVELIGTASAHSPNLIEAPQPLPRDAVQRYADWSQLRIRHWLSVLHDLPRELIAIPAELRPLLWERAEIVFADVLAGALVARVWGAILTACDRSRRTVAAEKVARGVLAGQLQAQERALRILRDGPHSTLERSMNLDRLRRQLERWTDLLLGHLVRRYAVVDFACDLERALDYGDEQAQDGWETRQHLIWDLRLLCLRSGFPPCRLPDGIQEIWRKKLVSSILGCFPPEMFDGHGRLLSVRMKRLFSSGARREGPLVPGKRMGPRFAGCDGRNGKGLVGGNPPNTGDGSGVTP